MINLSIQKKVNPLILNAELEKEEIVDPLFFFIDS